MRLIPIDCRRAVFDDAVVRIRINNSKWSWRCDYIDVIVLIRNIYRSPSVFYLSGNELKIIASGYIRQAMSSSGNDT
ncbi:hypothetical protein D9M68_888070 [compost metagenome]